MKQILVMEQVLYQGKRIEIIWIKEMQIKSLKIDFQKVIKMVWCYEYYPIAIRYSDGKSRIPEMLKILFLVNRVKKGLLQTLLRMQERTHKQLTTKLKTEYKNIDQQRHLQSY